jgi:cellulose synthase/poly-beta-1,6-N-acetylglucosamine synthase-like glycosyltransferase
VNPDELLQYSWHFSNLLMLFYCLLFAIQAWYYLHYFLPFGNYERSAEISIEDLPPLSIIVAAKNEADNLQRLLPELCKQNYPKFEIIIVDDHSAEPMDKIVEQYHTETVPVRYLELTEGEGKKAAVRYGISQATYKHYLFTDADCVPATEVWALKMASKFNALKEIVLGYGKFVDKPTLLNLLARYECMINATQYFSFSLKGSPYMGVGRNLAYNQQAAENGQSIFHNPKIISGDDDLLVNAVADQLNTAINPFPEAHTISETEESWSRFFHQKRRQLQAGKYYRKRDKRKLAILGASQLLFPFLAIGLFIYDYSIFIILVIFAAKLLIQYRVYAKVNKKFKEAYLLPWMPLLEIVYLIIISFIGITTWIWKVNRWK